MPRMRKRIHTEEEPQQIPFQIKEACLLIPQLTNPLPPSLLPSLPFPPAFSRDRESRSLPRLTPTTASLAARHCTRCADGEQLQPITPYLSLASFESGVLFLSHHLSKPTLLLKLSSQIKSDSERSETVLNCSYIFYR